VVVVVESVEEGVEIVAGVGPVERVGLGVVSVLEREDAFGEGVQVGEVAWVDGLALQDGEVDLD